MQPKETASISAISSVYPADQVAAWIVGGLANKCYTLYSPDLGLNLHVHMMQASRSAASPTFGSQLWGALTRVLAGPSPLVDGARATLWHLRVVDAQGLVPQGFFSLLIAVLVGWVAPVVQAVHGFMFDGISRKAAPARFAKLRAPPPAGGAADGGGGEGETAPAPAS